MKKLLITGASGFIGRNIIEQISFSDFEVHALYFNNKVENKNILWHRANLLDFESINKVFSEVKPTHLLHLAWSVEPGEYMNSINNLSWVQGSIEIIKAFKKNGGERAVFAGTCLEYDTSFGYLNEKTTPLNYCSLYGSSKAALYNLASRFCIDNEISFVWGRIFYLYGPYEKSKRVVPYVINSLLKNQIATCSSGTQIMDYLYVKDVAKAFIMLLKSDITGAFNIGSGSPIELMQIINLIAKKLEKRYLIRLGQIPPTNYETKLIVADNSRLINELGWTQEWLIDRGLEETINWWRTYL